MAELARDLYDATPELNIIARSIKNLEKELEKELNKINIKRVDESQANIYYLLNKIVGVGPLYPDSAARLDMLESKFKTLKASDKFQEVKKLIDEENKPW